MAEKRIIPPDWEPKIKWNVKLFRLINSKRSKNLDRFYRYFFYMGKTYSLIVFFPIFFVMSGVKGVLHLTISLIITGILMPLLKYTFRHKRPFRLLDDVYLLEPVTLKSFPSADAAFAFTVMGVAAFYGNVMD
ncbi:MAG: phosphatase PAP2 family protein [Persephonella sp.]|nr:phosphatase PAP2 family protein [Persephonella sp.]